MADIPLEKPKIPQKSSLPEGVPLTNGGNLDKSQMKPIGTTPEIAPEGMERAVETVIIGTDIPKKPASSASKIVVTGEENLISKNKIASKTIDKKKDIKNISREDLIKSLFIIANTLGYAQVTSLLFEVVKGIEAPENIAVKIDHAKQK